MRQRSPDLLISSVIACIIWAGDSLAAGDQARSAEAEAAGRPIAHWTFDGHLMDGSGNEYHGLWNGTGSNPPKDRFVEGVPGSNGRAIRFEAGEQALISHDPIDFEMSDSHTVTMWQFLSEDAIRHWNAFLGTGLSGDGGYWMFHSSRLAKYQSFGFIHRFSVHLGQTAPIGEWFHLAIVTGPSTRESGKVNYRIYINGAFKRGRYGREQAADLVWSPDVQRFRYSNIGGNGQNRWFTGVIDDMRIYDRALTEYEIRELHNLWSR